MAPKCEWLSPPKLSRGATSHEPRGDATLNTLESVKRRGITLFTLGALSLEPTGAFAHAFGERYDLPVPMSWVILAACCVMVLTVLFAVFWPSKVRTQQALEGLSNVGESAPKHPSNISPFTRACGWAGMLLLVLCFLCANLGTQDPLMNFAPTFIWIIWWLGTSFGVVVFGNFWPCINPWLAIDRVINPSNKPSVLSYPKHLGQWPGVFVLLCWCALEVVYPIAAMPERLSWWIVAYSCYMLLGLSLFGQDIWCAKADGFSIYFEWLASQRKERVLVHTKDPHTAPDPINFSTQLSEIAFVIAMFASVLFDGLHASQMWPPLEATVMRWGILSHDLNGYQLGVWELVCVWFLFVCMYLLSCAAV